MGTGGAGGATAGTGAMTAGSATTGGSGGASTTTGGATGTLKTKCEGGERLGCSSFIGPNGAEIPLGKYGAAMDRNVGKEFANPVDAGQEGPLQCRLFVAAFGQSQEENDKVLDTGDLDFGLYTVYRPANWGEGERYPIISWGNGTCAQPEGYGVLLRYVASHGFVVFAANSRWVGNDNAAAMKRALDFAFASNMDATSPYYQRLDTTKVGAMGHSQGGGATKTASSDSRIGTVILFNGGSKAAKPYLTISGDRDVGGQTAASLRSEVQSMPKAAFLFFHMIPGNGSSDGHLTLMKQPERLMAQTVDWFKMMLAGDAAAKAKFVGASCGYCGHDTEYEYGQNGL
jgi:hypothetical protein